MPPKRKQLFNRSAQTSSKLSIECGERAVRMVQSRRTNDAVFVERTIDFQWPPEISFQEKPAEAGAWLNEKLIARFSDWTDGSMDTTAVLDRNAYIIKSVTLPADSVEEAASMAKYQAATQFSMPIDELVVRSRGWQFDDKTGCHLFALPKVVCDRWRTFCDKAGLKLTGMVPRAVAVSECLDFEAEPTSAIRIAILRDPLNEKDEAEICLFAAGYLIESTKVTLPGDQAILAKTLGGNVRRVLAQSDVDAQHGESPRGDIGRVEASAEAVIVLLGDVASDLPKQLANNTGLVVRKFNLNLGVRRTDRISAEEGHDSVGLLSDAIAIERPIDFLGDPQSSSHLKRLRTPAQKRLKGIVRQLFSIVTILVLSLVVLQKFNEFKLERAVSKLVQEKRQINQQVEQGRSDIRLAHAIKRWQQPNVSGSFESVLNRIPPTDKTKLLKLELSVPAKTNNVNIRANGAASEKAAVEKLHQQLINSRQFRLQRRELQNDSSDKEKPIRFEFEFNSFNPDVAPMAEASNVVPLPQDPDEPLKESDQIARAEHELTKAEIELAELTNIRQRLRSHAQRTLSSDPAAVSAIFKQHLLELTQQHGFENAELVAQHATESDRMVVIPFSIQTTATLEQFQRFLVHLKQLKLLNRITQVSVEPIISAAADNSTDPGLACRIQLETVCLDVEGAHIESTGQSIRISAIPNVRVANNPFAIVGHPADRSKVRIAQQPIVLELVGLIEKGDQSEVQLLNRSTGQKHNVKLNREFKHESLVGRLLAVTKKRAIVLFDNARYEMSIGDTTRPILRIADRYSK